MYKMTGTILRVDLGGPLSDQLKTIKEGRGLKNNTEVIRILIREAYQSLDDAKTPHLVDDGGEEQEVVVA